MRTLTLALAFLWTNTVLFGQEMPLRVQGIQLLELSNKASLISGAPNLRMDAAYQAYGLDGNRTEGAFHRILTKDGQWSESIAAGLHVVAVFTKTQILQSTYVPPPAEMTEALSLLPVKLVR